MRSFIVSLLGSAAAISICVAGVAPLCAAEIKALPSGSVVLEGEIKTGDYDKLRSIARNGNVGGQLFYLASPGGDLLEAMKIGRLVRALKWSTTIPSRLNPAMQAKKAPEFHLTNPKANYMCASACFFVFAAGTSRYDDVADGTPILGIHRPYLPDSELRTLSGDQAIASAQTVRAVVENYLKEMSVPSKYADLMFSVPKDKIRWIDNDDFIADLEGIIPELKPWVDAKCVTLTDAERATWEYFRDNKGGHERFTEADKAITTKLLEKMRDHAECSVQILDELRRGAWVKMFQP